MDWGLAIERNREALKRILAMLVAMAGLVNGQSAIASRQSGPAQADAGPTDCLLPAAGCRITLPRHLHRVVLRLLRPAESAARRLVIVAARGLVLPPLRPRQPCPRPTDAHRPMQPAKKAGDCAPPVPALPLFDLLPRYGRTSRSRPAPAGMPRISVPGFTAPAPVVVRCPPSAFDPLDATRLALRLAALTRVLDNLPQAARRFARWKARSAAAQGESPRTVRFCRVWPLRPGRPPGHRRAGSRRPAHEVDEVLDTVHDLAFWALERPDTS